MLQIKDQDCGLNEHPSLVLLQVLLGQPEVGHRDVAVDVEQEAAGN